ncbi:hypothetical protein D3C71_77770 [compost metagenome]
MSAVLKPTAKVSQHQTLISYEAKGMFFLRMAMTEHTDGPNLLEIAKRAQALYNTTIDERRPCYQPVFRFKVMDDEHVELRMFRSGTGQDEDVCQGTIKLALLHRTPYDSILVLDPNEVEPQQDELFH